jgi:hypothetical protein
MREEQIFQLKITALQLALSPVAIPTAGATQLDLAKDLYNWIIEETKEATVAK